MMRTRSLGPLLILAGGITSAQSADDRIAGMESCFQAARLADTICSKLASDPAQRLDCLQKTRVTQLECLEHVLPDAPAGASAPRESSHLNPPATVAEHETLADPPSRTASPAISTSSSLPQETNSPPKANPDTMPPSPAAPSPTVDAAVRDGSSEDKLLKQPGRTEAPAKSTETSTEANSPLKATPELARTESSLPANGAIPESPLKEALLKQPGRTESPARSIESSLPPAPDNPPSETLGWKPTQGLASPEVTTGAISPDRSAKSAAFPPRLISDWVISETTSPVDYSPLVTALIRSTPQGKNAAEALIVRCRGQRTELMLRTAGAWNAARGSELRGEYQINDQRAVGQQWTLSSDGRTVTYNGEAVRLLRSVSDGASLKINITDQSSPSHGATFRLDGWDVVRKKIGAACKWPPTPDKALSEGR